VTFPLAIGLIIKIRNISSGVKVGGWPWLRVITLLTTA
jgi:hypothetical protein